MKIVLFCCSGYSSSILMKNMQTCISNLGLSYQLEAHAICEITQANDCDVILLSPQVRFNLPKMKAMYPNKPIALIEQQHFETANGEAILKQIEDLCCL